APRMLSWSSDAWVTSRWSFARRERAPRVPFGECRIRTVSAGARSIAAIPRSWASMSSAHALLSVSGMPIQNNDSKNPDRDNPNKKDTSKEIERDTQRQRQQEEQERQRQPQSQPGGAIESEDEDSDKERDEEEDEGMNIDVERDEPTPRNLDPYRQP